MDPVRLPFPPREVPDHPAQLLFAAYRSFLDLKLPDDPTSPSNPKNMLAEDALARWWQANGGDNVILWVLMVPYRLADPERQLQHVPDVETYLEHLMKMPDAYLLFYSVNDTELVIWGRANEVALKKDTTNSQPMCSVLWSALGEVITPTKLSTTVNRLPQLDCWFYTDLETPIMGELSDDKQHTKKLFEEVLGALRKLYALVLRMIRKKEPGDAEAAETKFYTDTFPREYASLFPLHTQLGRLEDHRIRLLLFFATLIAPPAQRKSLVQLGAMMVNSLAKGWIRESQVAYLATMNALDVAHCDIPPLMLERNTTDCFVLQEDNSMRYQQAGIQPSGGGGIFLRQDNSSLEQVAKEYRPLLFAPLDVAQEEWVNSLLEASYQWRRDRVLVQHQTSPKWMFRPSAEPRQRHVLLDQLPTRLYLLEGMPEPQQLFPQYPLPFQLLWKTPSGVRVYDAVVGSLKDLREALKATHIEYQPGTSWLVEDPDKLLQPSLQTLKHEWSQPRNIATGAVYVPPPVRINKRDLAEAVEPWLLDPQSKKPQLVWIVRSATFQHNVTLHPIAEEMPQVAGGEITLLNFHHFGLLLAGRYQQLVHCSTKLLHDNWKGRLDIYMHDVWGAPMHEKAIQRILEEVRNVASETPLSSSASTSPESSTSSLAGTPYTISVFGDDTMDGMHQQNHIQHAQLITVAQFKASEKLFGSQEEKQQWSKYARSEGESFRDFLYRRVAKGKGPKTSIGVDVMPATPEYPDATWKWTDWKTKIYGIGPGDLITHWLMGEFLVRKGVSPLVLSRAPSFDIVRQMRDAFGSKNKEGNPQLYQALVKANPRYHNHLEKKPRSYFYMVQQFLDEQNASEKGRHTSYWYILDTQKRFFDEKPKPLAGGPKKRSRTTPVGEQERDQKRTELTKLYHDCVKIHNTPAQQYLREKRQLWDLSSDVLEKSPYLRYHPALPYHIKSDGKSTAATGTTRHFPTLLCFCVNDKGEMVGLQRIYLDMAQANGKLAFTDGGKINKSKLSAGHLTAENAFFLAQPGNLDLLPMIFLCEGPETAWSVSSVSIHMRVYASFGVGNFKRFREYLDDKRKITLCLCLDQAKTGASEKEQKSLDNTNAAHITALKQAGWRVVARQPNCKCCKDLDDYRKTHGVWQLRELFNFRHPRPLMCHPPEELQWSKK
jgi:hypothetical protein